MVPEEWLIFKAVLSLNFKSSYKLFSVGYLSSSKQNLSSKPIYPFVTPALDKYTDSKIIKFAETGHEESEDFMFQDLNYGPHRTWSKIT